FVRRAFVHSEEDGGRGYQPLPVSSEPPRWRARQGALRSYRRLEGPAVRPLLYFPAMREHGGTRGPLTGPFGPALFAGGRPLLSRKSARERRGCRQQSTYMQMPVDINVDSNLHVPKRYLTRG